MRRLALFALLFSACVAQSQRAEAPAPDANQLAPWWSVKDGRLVCGRHSTHESSDVEMLSVAEVTSRRFKLEADALVEVATPPERWGVSAVLAPRFVVSWPRDVAARDLRERAERLVERGELDEAIALYDLARASGGEESTRALETIRGLRARMPAAMATADVSSLVLSHERQSNVVDDGKALAHSTGTVTASSDGRRVWSCNVFARGDRVVWRVLGEERSTFVVLGGGVVVRHLVPETLLCANGTLPGPVFLSGIDRAGKLVWQTELPGLGCPPATQVYALGLGRVFVGHPDHALALDATTGIIEWARVRERSFAAPAGAGEPPRPEGWPCGDASRAFSMKLVGRTLELTTGDETRRLDAATGEVLDVR